ncbi:MAG: DUF3054 family protein, partial [Acidobacteriota bacterium]|nr:DUF3054 family protein [Acidobacteriota bacterium]
PLLARRWNGASMGGGLVVLTSTVVVGMALRAVSGQGTAVAFVVVAVLFLGLFTLGPRWMVIRRRSRVGGRPAAEA